MPNRTANLTCTIVLGGKTIAFTLPGVNMMELRPLNIKEHTSHLSVDHVIDRQQIGYVDGIELDELPGEANDTLFVRVMDIDQMFDVAEEVHRLLIEWLGGDFGLGLVAVPRGTGGRGWPVIE